MKLFCGLAVVVAVFLVACASTGEDSRGLPLPNLELATAAGITVEQMGEGYWVFNRKCMECHEAKLPSGKLDDQWHPVVSGVPGNAGLSVSEETAIFNYVRAADQRK